MLELGRRIGADLADVLSHVVGLRQGDDERGAEVVVLETHTLLVGAVHDVGGGDVVGRTVGVQLLPTDDGTA